MIFAITVLSGMLLFQLLVSWEAFRQYIHKVNKDLNIQWFVLPKTEQPWMRRQPGVQSLEDDPKAWNQAWREMISPD